MKRQLQLQGEPDEIARTLNAMIARNRILQKCEGAGYFVLLAGPVLLVPFTIGDTPPELPIWALVPFGLFAVAVIAICVWAISAVKDGSKLEQLMTLVKSLEGREVSSLSLQADLVPTSHYTHRLGSTSAVTGIAREGEVDMVYRDPWLRLSALTSVAEIQGQLERTRWRYTEAKAEEWQIETMSLTLRLPAGEQTPRDLEERWQRSPHGDIKSRTPAEPGLLLTFQSRPESWQDAPSLAPSEWLAWTFHDQQ